MRQTNLYLAIASITVSAALSAQGIAQDSLFIRSFGPADYRASNFNYSVTEDQNGILYFANENGVLEYDGSKWQLHPLPDYSYNVTVKMSPDGKLYLGGRNEFGYMERDSIGGLQYVSLRNLVDQDLEMEEFWQITFHKGQVYFQSYESIIRFDGELGYNTKIEDGWIFHQNDDLFVSVINRGLGKLVDDSVVYLNTELKLENDNPLACLPYKGREKILVTEYHGLYLMDTITLDTRPWDVPANEAFMEKFVWDAEVWNDSIFVFSFIEGGLTWMNNRGEIVKTLDTESGLNSPETHALLKDPLGNLWVTGSGIHHLIWPEENYRENVTGVLIRNITLNELRIPFDKSDTSYISDEFGPIKSLTIAYTAPGVDHADVQYSCFLEGFDKDWSEWTDDSNKQYTNLDEGKYTFRVKAKLASGELQKEAQFGLMIPTIWYRSPWAKVTGGLAVWLLVVSVIKLRTKQLTGRNKKLESIINQRTGELKYSNEELLKRNYELDQFVRRVSHDLVAPIKSVKALIEISRMEDTIEEQDKCFEMIKLSLDKQEDFVKKMLDQALSYKEMNLEVIELRGFCSEVIQELSNYDGAEQIEMTCDFSHEFKIETDPVRLKIVLKNLLDNAIKYRRLEASNSTATIRASETETHTILEIEDNGIGIPNEHLEVIFGMFKRATDQRHGTGLGLYIVKDIVSSLKGKVELTSELGKGTTFTITFPKNKDHSQS